MKKRIMLDVDGILANFVAGAAAFHGKDPASFSSGDIVETWGFTASDFWNPLGYDFWANLPVYDTAEEVVDICQKAVGPENVCLLTSPCATRGCAEGKIEWVRKHFPQFKRRVLVGEAKEFCASPTSMLVDDHDNNIDAFHRAGGWVFLYPRPWNRNRGLILPPTELLTYHLEGFVYSD